MPLPRWKSVAVSVPGFAHQENDLPCEDFHEISTIDDWFVAAVSDGAGTASNSGEGSAAICKGVVERIVIQLSRSDNQYTTDFAATIRAWVEAEIRDVRAQLVTNQMRSLMSFHATLVGVVANSQGGVFFHIGDGAGLAMTSGNFGSYIISSPDNGEYPDETYFFTDHEWQKHLRVTSFGSEYDLIALMTDGVTPFALAQGANGPHIPFLLPVSRYLASSTREAGETALADTLNQIAVRKITNDDKTLVWALRSDEYG
jgi:hypothetical protein